MCAARKRHFARSCGETRFHVSKYLLASSIACRAISAEAFCKTPMISIGCEGFVEVRFSVVVTFFPLSHIGYSRPNSAFTFFSASCVRARFSAFVKSINGSLVNSETWTICSAVAMAGSLLRVQTAHCTAPAKWPTSSAPELPQCFCSGRPAFTPTPVGEAGAFALVTHSWLCSLLFWRRGTALYPL